MDHYIDLILCRLAGATTAESFTAVGFFVLAGLLIVMIATAMVTRVRGDVQLRAHAVFFTVFDALATARRSGADNDLDIIRSIGRSEYDLFGDYLLERIGQPDRRDISAESAMAEISGFADHLRRSVPRLNPDRKALALRILSCLRSPSDLPLFRDQLRGNSGHACKYAASLGIALCGDLDSIPAVIEHLYRTDPPNRDQLAVVLSLYQENAAPQFMQLLEAPSTPNPVKGLLADLLGLTRYRPALPSLLRTLACAGDPDTRAHVIEALERLRAPEAASALEPFLSDPDFRVRLKTVNALERIAGARYIAMAEQMMNDGNHWVRRNAAESMARMGEEGISRLKALAVTGEANVRSAAKLILAERQYRSTRWRFRYAESVP